MSGESIIRRKLSKYSTTRGPETEEEGGQYVTGGGGVSWEPVVCLCYDILYRSQNVRYNDCTRLDIYNISIMSRLGK